MKKIKLLFIAAAALVSGSAMAQKIVCPDATFSAEGKANLVFSIADNTDETATLAEFTLALPEGVTIDLRVDDATVQGAEASEGITREEGGATKGYHRFWPVNHGSQYEIQCLFSQFDSITVLNF